MSARRAASGAGRPDFELAEHRVRPGRRVKLELPIARLMSGTPVALPVLVLHGREPGPVAWLSAAIHGDELCGVEIIRRVLARLDPKRLRGTVIAVPIVNVHGFNRGERYLPDRRDLNRAFPGSSRGSLAARLAHLMMSEVVGRSEFGIDLHTGSDHRINLPQVRANLDQPAARELTLAFGAPLAMHSRPRKGTLRQAAGAAGATAVAYEGGEPDRFDGPAIAAGTAGVLRALAARDMIDDPPPAPSPTLLSRRSTWVRASRSGILHLDVALGDEIRAGESLATIYDPFGKRLGAVRAKTSGVIAGHTQRPLVNRGDAVAHIAEVDDPAPTPGTDPGGGIG